MMEDKTFTKLSEVEEEEEAKVNIQGVFFDWSRPEKF